MLRFFNFAKFHPRPADAHCTEIGGHQLPDTVGNSRLMRASDSLVNSSSMSQAITETRGHHDNHGMNPSVVPASSMLTRLQALHCEEAQMKHGKTMLPMTVPCKSKYKMGAVSGICNVSSTSVSCSGRRL